MHAALFGVGRLQPLLDDQDIENIDVNGCDSVFVSYADGREERVEPVADSDEELIELIQLLGAYSGLPSRSFDTANPQLDLRLPDGSRLSAVMDVCRRPAVSIRLFAAHPTQWVPAGRDPNAAIEIPPETLMHIALSQLTLDDPPVLQVNPDGSSVVNLPTWVWATDDSFMEHRVRAAFNGNWAEVIAEPVGLELHANGPHELHGDCAGGGVVYQPGATTNCSVTFLKSSGAQGAYTISATIEWRVHWEGSGGQNEPLAPPDSPGLGSIDVQVDEVQTVLENNPTPMRSGAPVR